MQIRINLLREILAEKGDPEYADSALGRQFVTSVAQMGDVSNNYQVCWDRIVGRAFY